jgi:hypothetical protein
MGRLYEQIEPPLAEWLLAQPVYFVATAPLAGDGHLNVSPKGMAGTFAVLDPQRVGYLDYTGSGAETIAHLRENGRIVIMFCAFDGKPKIVRLHGRGRFVLAGTREFDELRGAFPKEQEMGQRSIVVVDVDRVSDSCGFAVPRLTYADDRDLLDRSHERRDPAYLDQYWKRKNSASIDGLPALDPG